MTVCCNLFEDRELDHKLAIHLPIQKLLQHTYFNDHIASIDDKIKIYLVHPLVLTETNCNSKLHSTGQSKGIGLSFWAMLTILSKGINLKKMRESHKGLLT